MSYLVLARKYRPATFEDVAGQEHVTKTLLNGLHTGHIAHAYLFSGPRGVGKTTAARILAKVINCTAPSDKAPCNVCTACKEVNTGSSIDIIEVDGASNRGIDEVRDLRENVKFAPAHLTYKVYIIDEVHMLTEQAFNALLKTLEEPPKHIVFIFATTELHKIPETILSRCQKFHFKLIPLTTIVTRLEEILHTETITFEQDALMLIAHAAQGSMRDALSLLDQVLAYSPKHITKHDTEFILGVMDEEVLFSIIAAIIGHNTSLLLSLLEQLMNAGHDIQHIAADLREHYRTLMLLKIDPALAERLSLVPENIPRYTQQAEALTLGKITRDITVLSDTIEAMKWSEYPRLVFEICLVKLSTPYCSPDELVARLETMQSPILDAPYHTPLPPTAHQSSSMPNTVSTHASHEQDVAIKEKKPSHITPQAAIQKKEKIAPMTAVRMNEPTQEYTTPSEPENATLVSEDLRICWKKAIAIAKKEKVYFSSYLSDDQEIELHDNAMTIFFGTLFHANGVAKHKQVVENALQQVFGKTIRIVCQNTGTGTASRTAPDTASSLAPSLDDVPDALPTSSMDNQEDGAVTTATECADNTVLSYTPDEIVQAEPVIKHVLDLFDGELVPPKR